MNTLVKFASLSVAALLISTTMASAFDPIGVNSTIAPTPQDSMNDAVQSQSASDSMNDAVQFDPKRDINDAVLAGAKTGKGGNGGKVLLNGKTIVLALVCKTGGSELLTVSNKGDAVPAGTKLRWEVQSRGERGIVRLKQTLGTGAQVRVDIGTSVDAGTTCAARVI